MAAMARRVAAVAASVLTLAAMLLFLLVGLGPRTGAYQTRTVLSSSMAGTLDAGDVVIARPKPSDELRVGDVITYVAPVEDRRLVTHRVVEIVQPGPRPVVRTKGDAVTAADPWVAQLQEGTVWVMAGRLPKLGYLIHYLQRPTGRALTALAAPIALAAILLRQLWRKDRSLAAPRARWRPGPLLQRTAAVGAVGVLVVAVPTVAHAAWTDGAVASADYASDTLAAPTNPSTAAGTCVIAVSDQIVVQWTPTSSTWAGGYEIRRSTVDGGPYSVVGTVSGQETSSYTDGPLPFSTTYYYVVAATKGNWRSPDTSQVSRTTRSTVCLI